MAPINNIDTFINKINFHKEKEEVDLYQFDTIILDADETIWDIKDKAGIAIPASQTLPPYQKTTENPNLLIDRNGNEILIKDNFISTINQLKNQGKTLYIISYSDDQKSEYENQPVILILKAAGIYDLFEDVIVDDETPKSTYVDKIDTGNSIFIDDNEKNLIDVSLHTDVDTCDINEHKDVFSWYNTVIQSEASIIDDQYEDIKRKIEQDIKFSKENVFTLRDDRGELKFRVNLGNGEIIQVNPEFKKINPKIYEGLKIPYVILKDLGKANSEKLLHYKNRLNLLEKNFKKQEISCENLSDFLSNDQVIKQKISETKLIDNNNVDESKLEEFLNELDVMPKFIAGVAQIFLFFKEGSPISQIEAKNLAEQIANFEVFGSFTGEEEFRRENNLDFIPLTQEQEKVDPEEYVKNKISYLDGNKAEKLKNNMKTQISKMNSWIEQGMYMYDNKNTKQFSDQFKKKFGFYMEQCSLVDSLSEQILNKMKKIAGDFIQ